MALFSKKAAGDHPGDWFTYATDPDTGKPVKFRVRRLPAERLRKLRAQKVKIESGGVTVIDMAAEEIRQRAEALECWTEAQNLELLPETHEEAAAFEKMAPGLTFGAGKATTIDDGLSEDIKTHILTKFPEVVGFIREKARALQTDVEKEEDAARKN